VEAERPDILISDIGMPEVDGYELLRRIRALGPTRGGKVPAIALTAFARPEDRAHSLRVGYSMHVSKPIRPDRLTATVATLAGRKARSDGYSPAEQP
jgi:CheY-like chemotaxis protein